MFFGAVERMITCIVDAAYSRQGIGSILSPLVDCPIDAIYVGIG